MRFAVPIFAIVDAKDPTEAEAIRQKLETFLGQNMIRMTIHAQGIKFQGATVGAPYAVKDDYVPAPGATGPGTPRR